MTEFQEMLRHTLRRPSDLKVIVVGGGLVGCKFADELSTLLPEVQLTVIGDEPLYDRTQLVKLIDGRLATDAIMLNYSILPGHLTDINREHQVVHYTAHGRPNTLHYDVLVLATGASPFIPPIPGIEHTIALRRLADTQRIIDMQPASAAVVGGGVLGIEIAHALNNQGCKVSVIHAADRIMERQLDEDTSLHLQRAMEKDGVNFHLGAAASKVGKDFIEAEQHRIPADLVIMAAGVVPNDQLARTIGLDCDRGIIIDKDMRTSDPNIFAVGDCCHRSFCQVQPGYEQAQIAAKAIAGVEREAFQFIPSTCLKTHHKVYSIGCFEGKSIRYKNAHSFRKIWLDDGRIVGAVVLGECTNMPALRDAVYRNAPLSKWRQLFFKFTGNPWPFTVPDPAHWPVTTTICQCKGVSRGAITETIDNGANTIQAIGRDTGAGTGCGGCKPLLAQLLAIEPEPVRHHKALGFTASFAVILALVLAAFSIPYPDTFVENWSFIWRDFIAKQISGYSLLGIGILLAAIGIRKRTRKLTIGHFDTWRILHAALGLSALLGVFIHSGGRFGDGVVFLLSVSWLLTALAGGTLAAISARRHSLGISFLEPLRRAIHWSHILFLWPLPLLLGYHIAGAYLWR
jgi:nitrite reductase (NADH) large subunit